MSNQSMNQQEFDKSMGLYFPRVPNNISIDQFKTTIVSKNYGLIGKIDVVPKTHQVTGETYNAMFVHFDSWIECPPNIEFQRQVRDPNFKSIVYTGQKQYFWHVSENINKPLKVVVDEDLVAYKSKYIMALELLKATERMVEEKDVEISELYKQIAILRGSEKVSDTKMDTKMDIRELDLDDKYSSDDEDMDDEEDMFKSNKQLWYEYEVSYFENLEQEKLKNEIRLYREYEREYMNNLEQKQIIQFENQILQNVDHFLA